MFGNIKSFSVYGLFGVHDVHLTFKNNIMILIGENGLGKTHVLNLFYYVLTKKIHKLIKYDFEKIVVSIDKKNNSIEIIKKDLLEVDISADIEKLRPYSPRRRKEMQSIIDNVGIGKLKILYKEAFEDGAFIGATSFERILRKDRLLRQLPPELVYQVIRRLFHNQGELFEKNPLEAFSGISNYNVLYFPTYRRVEEDLNNLGLMDKDDEFDIVDNNAIQFGMDDVQHRFTKLESIVNELLKEGLTQFTNDILGMVIDDTKRTSPTVLDNVSIEDFSIILARAGSALTLRQKAAVQNVVLKKKSTNPLLLELLQKLIEIYEKQKKYDESINSFKDICNSYLRGKEVFYDESNIKIYVRNSRSQQPIPLSKLSSGEKQIISIFSKVYLSENEKFIILFDEPELSLSVTWQEKLLPDIYNSGSCLAILAVTHSPFIFDNDLGKYASNLQDYISDKKIIKAKRASL